MKILYDYQIFDWQKFGGISNMYTQLIKNLPVGVSYHLALRESNNVHLRDSGIMDVPSMTVSVDNFITNKQFRGKERLYNAYSRICPTRTSLGLNRMCSIDALKRGDYDIFHPTFFNSYFLPYLNGKPFVLTVYDMISEKFFSSSHMQTIEKKRQASLASHIIAISEKTKEDVIDILKVPEEKVSVMYLAATDIPIEKNSKAMVDGKYILFVGNRESYKNFMPMMTALLPILKRRPELKVVCTGAAFKKNESIFFQSNGIEDNVIHLMPSDKELCNLYSHAECFVYPSIYEGFGIPILEAWQCGCPVLLNHKSCFPEIARDAAVFFNLDENHSDLENVMESFLQMGAKDKAALIEKQNRRLADFSWRKSAEQLSQIYKLILQKKS